MTTWTMPGTDAHAGGRHSAPAGVTTREPGAVAGDWFIDPARSRVSLVLDENGSRTTVATFERVSGVLRVDLEHGERSRFEVQLPAAALTTGDDVRDDLVRGESLLDGRRHPNIVFRGDGIDEIGERAWLLSGVLGVRGVSQPLSVPVEVTDLGAGARGELTARLVGSRIVDRLELGLAATDVSAAFGRREPGTRVWCELDLAIGQRAARDRRRKGRGGRH